MADSSLATRAQTATRALLYGETIDILNHATGETLVKRVSKPMLLHFCYNGYAQRLLHTRLDGTTTLRLPDGSCEALGLTFVVQWMQRACAYGQFGNDGFQTGYKDALLACNAHRALCALGLYSDAEGAARQIESHYFTVRNLSAEVIECLWEKLPRDSTWLTVMCGMVRRILEEPRFGTPWREKIRAVVMESPSLKAFIRPGAPNMTARFESNERIEQWVMGIEDAPALPDGQLPKEESFPSSMELDSVPTIQFRGWRGSYTFELQGRVYTESAFTKPVDRPMVDSIVGRRQETPFGRAWHKNRPGM